MNARENHVIEAALAIPQKDQPKGSGFLDGVSMRVKISISAHRYARQLRRIVEERNSTIVNGRLTGDDFAQPTESLITGMRFDFEKLETREIVTQRSQALETFVQEAAETVAAELLDEIAIRTGGIQHLRDDLFDKRQLLQQVQNESAILPPPDEPESLRRPFKVERALDVAYSSFGRLRAAFALAVAQVVGIYSLESLLSYLILVPIFAGTAGIGQWMIVAQALILTLVLVFLGHLVWSANRGVRGLSATVLVVITSALAVVRAGVLNSGGADGAEPQNVTALAMIGVMSLSGLGLALIGGRAFHRAKKIVAKTSDLRSTVGVKVAEMEAELAEWKSNQARHRNRERELKRLLPRLEREIAHLETALQSETAETRLLVQQRVRDTVRHSLSSEITNMASQLARWRHDPKSANGNRGGPGAVMAPLLLGLALFTGTACTQPNQDLVHHTLLDSSGSISPDVTERMRMRVFDAARRWIETARPGDEFNLWWLTPEGSPYPADRRTLTMPPLTVPAHASRDAFSDEAMNTLEDWLGQLPQGVQRTRLLESLYYIASTEDHGWAITILSDLREDSPSWNSVRASNADDAGLVKAMLELCPTVTIPPVSVSLVSWPGIVNGNQDGIKEHEHARRLFTQFFERWAPEAEVRLSSI